MTRAQRQGIVMARGLTSLCRIAVWELASISYKYSIQETPLFLVISHEWIPFSGSLNISGTECFQSPYASVDREGCVISELESERLSLMNCWSYSNFRWLDLQWYGFCACKCDKDSFCLNWLVVCWDLSYTSWSICLSSSSASLSPSSLSLSLPRFLMCRRETQLSTSFESPW